MVECIAQAAKELLFVAILSIMFVYIYAVFGVTAFDYNTVQLNPEQPLNYPNAFSTVLNALKCMWKIFTNDHFLEVLFDAKQVQRLESVGWLILLRFYCDSTAVRPRFDRSMTSVSTGLPDCGLIKQIGQRTAVSGSAALLINALIIT